MTRRRTWTVLGPKRRDWRRIRSAKSWRCIKAEDGRTYTGGCLPGTPKLRKAVAQVPGVFNWRDAKPRLVPESEWVDTPDPRGYAWAEVDQGSNPSCCLSAHANDIHLFRESTGSKRVRVRFDDIYAWRELSGGRGGVAIASAVKYLFERGMPTKETVRRRLKAKKAYFLDGYKDRADFHVLLASALQLGRGLWGVVFGHDVHAETAWGMKQIGNRWYLNVLGSWGWDYGEKGWHWFPWDEAEEIYDAIIYRSFGTFETDKVGWD